MKKDDKNKGGDTAKRAKKIKSVKRLFRAIDVLYARRQNSCPFVSEEDYAQTTVINDVVYNDAAPEVCTLDYYARPSDKPLPAVLFIHGGGFTAGDKKYRRGRAMYYAKNGFAVFCLNYGLAPDFLFPQPVAHLVTGANFIFANAQRFNIDLSRLIVAGDSSGGYYAAMLAAIAGNTSLAEAMGGGLDRRFCAALFNCGVFDLETVLQSKFPFRLEQGVLLSLTGRRGEEMGEYKFRSVCSPAELVTAQFPPSFFAYSAHDIFCKGQSEIMQKKLKEAGVYCESYCARSRLSNHCYSLTWRSADAISANASLLSFAKRAARKGGFGELLLT